MPTLDDFAALGEKLLDADKFGWLEPLSELGEKWRIIAQNVRAAKADAKDIDTVQGLFDFFKGKLEEDWLVELFDDLDLGDLREKLLEFEELYANLPEEARELAAPVGDTAEKAVKPGKTDERPVGYRDDWVDGNDGREIAVPIPDFSADHEGSLGPLDFDLDFGASAHLTCEPNGLWPYSRDDVKGGLLQISCGAEVKASAGGTLPFNSGKLGGDASARARAELMYFRRPSSPKAIFAGELARAVRAMPNPFSLPGVWEAVAQHRLEGIILALDGTTEVELKLAVGKTADLPKVLSAELGITGNVRVNRKAAYVASIRQTGDAALGTQQLALAISRNKSAAHQWGVGVGLEVDISPLAGRVHTLLSEAMGEWTKEIEKIRPYLKPGTWLQDKAGDELEKLAEKLLKDHDGLREALIVDLGVVLGTADDSDDEGIAQALVGRITEKLDTFIVTTSEKAESKAGAAVEKLVESLPALAGDPIKEKLNETLTGLLEDLQDKLKGEIEGLAKAKPKQVTKALKKLGVKVEKAAKQADTATKGLVELVDKFEELMKQALAALEDSARHKIGVQLAFEESRVSELDMEIVATIDSTSAEAKRLYKAAMTGRFAELQALLEDGGKADGFTIDPDKSAIRRFVKVSRKTGFSFVAFGLEVKSELLLLGEADFKVLGNGDITVIAKSEATRSADGPREGRTASFVTMHDLLLARLDEDRAPELQRSMELTLKASHRDKSLKAREVSEFIDSLTSAGLASKDRVKRAAEVYEEWSSTGGSDARHPAGDIDLTFAFPRDSVTGLVARGQAIRDELESEAAPIVTAKCFAVALDACLRTGRISQRGFDDSLKELRKRKGSAKTDNLTDHEWLFGVVQGQRIDGGVAVNRHHRKVMRISSDEVKWRDLTNAIIAMNALADMLQVIAAIYHARPRSQSFANGWDEDDYADHKLLLAKTSSRWINLNQEWIFWFGRGMGKRTLAFLLTLTALVNRTSVADVIDGKLGDDMLSITMTRKDGDKPAEPVSI